MRINPATAAALVTLPLTISCAGPSGARAIACKPFPDGDPLVCERNSVGDIRVSPQSLAQLSFGPDGLGTILAGERDMYFVTRQGKTAPAFLYDNGPDYFADGLARTVRNGKIGFVNAQLDQVVEPVWDFAFPFEKGVTVVCTGCAPVAKSGEEHRVVSGGKWGYIDKRGKVVVPVEHDSRSLPPVETAAKLAMQ
jgi:hypothetical protein